MNRPSVIKRFKFPPWGGARGYVLWQGGVLRETCRLNPSLHPPVGRESHWPALLIYSCPMITLLKGRNSKGLSGFSQMPLDYLG